MYINSQTFYLDPNSVNQSATVFLTSVDLYFQAKPNATNNVSGINNPTVTICVSPTDSSGAPLFNSILSGSVVNLPYTSINVDATAATKTTFTFSAPLQLNTGNTYAINVQADDPAYILWTAQVGNDIVGAAQNTGFTGFSGGTPGQLFDYGNSGNITPVNNAQLKYGVNVAQFSSNNATYQLVNGDYEFFVITNQTGSFLGGERVFPLVANLTGTVAFSSGSNTVIGTGTSFQSTFATNTQLIVYTSANTYLVRNVVAISNNTVMTVDQSFPSTNTSANFFTAPIGVSYYNNQSANVLYLSNSTASNSNYLFNRGTYFTATLTNGNNQYTGLSSTTNLFVGQPITANVAGITTGTTISAIVNSSAINVSTSFTGTTGTAQVYSLTPVVGEFTGTTAYISSIVNFPVGSFQPEIVINTPQSATYALSSQFAYSSSNSYALTPVQAAVNYANNTLSGYNAVVASRSHEVVAATNTLYGVRNKSGVLNITLTQNTTGSIYSSPVVTSEGLDVYSSAVTINNTLVGETAPTSGLSASRHITTKINFDSTYPAQDLVVQTISYIPAGTYVQPYAKIYNSHDSDGFNAKEWTLLYPANASSNAVSSPVTNNYIAQSWGLPAFPPSAYTANGSVTVGVAFSPTANAVVTGANTNFGTEIPVNSVVKIWNPLIPSNYVIAAVTSVTSNTTLTLDTAVSNTSILGQPGYYIDLINDPSQTFNNPQNQNIARYYNTSLTPVDGYDTLQVKLVLISNSTSVTPRVASLTAIGTSS